MHIRRISREINTPLQEANIVTYIERNRCGRYRTVVKELPPSVGRQTRRILRLELHDAFEVCQTFFRTIEPIRQLG